MRLTREEWEQLDDLIGKIGFGGYYDMLHCMNMVASDLALILLIESDDQQNITDAYHNIRALTNLLLKKFKDEYTSKNTKVTSVDVYFDRVETDGHGRK